MRVEVALEDACMNIEAETRLFTDRSVMVTGGAGFLGESVVRHLKQLHCRAIIVPRRSEFDLTRESHVQRLFKEHHPDLVIHLAALVGGIEFARQHPADMFYQNLIMNTLIFEYSRRANVGKFVGIGTACSYPESAPVPLREDDLWLGYPEIVNSPYGMAKKMMLVQSESYRRQYGFNSVSVVLALE